MLAELFSDDMIGQSLTFTAATALHNIYLKPQDRYSEDIGLVRLQGSINLILKRIGEMPGFLGLTRVVKQKANTNTIFYHYESEIAPVINMRLKIEINCGGAFQCVRLV